MRGDLGDLGFFPASGSGRRVIGLTPLGDIGVGIRVCVGVDVGVCVDVDVGVCVDVGVTWFFITSEDMPSSFMDIGFVTKMGFLSVSLLEFDPSLSLPLSPFISADVFKLE